MEYTKHLAQFAAQLEYSDLPLPAIARAKELALHSWGVQLAGSTLSGTRAAYRFVQKQGGAPQSTVVNYGLKTSAFNAAFVNGTFGHGFEMDDNHAATSIKGGCAVVPAALAVGEVEGSTGKDFIVAVVAAYEVMLRIALAVTPALSQRGHHPTGSSGPFGAAVATGKLLHLDETKMLHAISTAAGHSAGIAEAPAEGRGDLKRIFGGMAASNGVRSALLAYEGLTGPATMLEGERGFCRAFADGTKLSRLTEGLGTQWQILEVHYKIYAQDGYIQPMTQILEGMKQKHGFEPEDIEEIRAGTNSAAHNHIIGVIREPQDVTSAQFSANFSLALFLVTGGAGFREYTAENLNDPRIVSLSRKIHTYIDEEIEREWQKARPRGARITVQLKSGQTFSDCIHMLRVMTAEDVNEKVRRMTDIAAVPPERCEELIRRVRNLEEVRDVSSLVPFLCEGLVPPSVEY